MLVLVLLAATVLLWLRNLWGIGALVAACSKAAGICPICLDVLCDDNGPFELPLRGRVQSDPVVAPLTRLRNHLRQAACRNLVLGSQGQEYLAMVLCSSMDSSWVWMPTCSLSTREGR
jgi:hypothetical protein